MKSPILALSASLLVPVIAAGQDAAPQSSSQLEEIVVTAQRREESLQTVPVAVSAFSASQLENRQATSTIDLVKLVPNFFGHNNTGVSTANTYFLRGLGSTEQIATIDPAVTTYVDDVIIPRQNANNYALFDVDRLEVLRGPQGTTFGRNTTGGAINVITRKPGNKLAGSASIGGGNFGKKLARGSIDVPVNDKVLTKFSAFYTEDDGWLTNLANGEKTNGSKNWGARAAVRLLPADDVTWDLSAEYIVADGVFLRSYGVDRDIMFSPFTKSGATTDTVGDMLNKRGLRNDTASKGLASTLEWKWGGATVSSITGWRSQSQTFILDFGDPFPVVAGVRQPADKFPNNFLTFALNNVGTYDMFSQEFKAVGHATDSVRYVAGVYFFSEDNQTKAGQATGSATAGVPLTLSCSPGLFGEGPIACGAARGYSSFRDIRNKTTSYAAYAQVDWKVADKWTVIAGGRFTDDKKTLDLKQTAQGGMTTADLVAAGVATQLKSSEFTPKGGINFQATENVMFYASGVRGFKSGGWNARTAYRPQEFQPMQPEKTTSYEVGMKSELFDRRVRLNATAYWAKTKGLQLSYSTPGPIAGTTLSTQNNAGDIKTKGLEIEFAAKVNSYVDVYASLGLQDGEYTYVNPAAQSFCTNGGSIVNGGCANPRPPAVTTAFVNAIDLADKLSRFPKNNGNLGLNVRIPIAGLAGDLRFNVEGQHTGKFATTASNAVPNLQLIPGGPFVSGPTVYNTLADSYTIFNASVGYESTDGKWRASLDCKNCSDKAYVISVFNGIFFGDPRRVNFSVGYKF